MRAWRFTIGAAAVLVAAFPAHAQRTERAVFLVRQGSDTLAVETASYTPGRAESSILFRQPLMRLRNVMTLNEAGELVRLETTAGAGVKGDSAATRSDLVVKGDSATLRFTSGAGAAPSPRTIAFTRGAVPFVNLSGHTLELILRRARTGGGDAVSVPLLLPTGQSIPLRVTFVAKDSAVISVSGVDIRVRTDAAGRLLGGAVPAQGVIFERLAANSRAAAWTPARVSYDAPANAPYTAEHIALRTPAGVTLAGTLTMPRHRTGARVPAVVLITGSGAQDRDAAVPMIAGYRPFRQFADTLSRRGIAVLRLDDRGVGGSDRGPAIATTADFADDIRAALAWLRARADVDSTRLGLVGHSEGGIIAPMVAATDPRLRGIVLIAGQSRTGRAISAYQRRYAIEHDRTIPVARRADALARSDRAVDSVFAIPGWLRFWADYDPLPTARRVRVPTLILQGETDRQVTADQATELAAALRAGGNQNVTLRTFPRMNHLLLDDASGDPKGYDALPSHAVRRDLLGVLADWLARIL
jgi:alpha-beta hydrolase superfamily lysophospholipase